MKAMIFAAGLGTRLRPLTDNMPKALVPVAGKPMLQHVIERIKAAGFNEITINIHHFGEQIIDFLAANQQFGITIHISDERGELLDTGGGIKKARPFLDGNEPFLVHNADILTDIDLRKLFQYHIDNNADATLLVSQRNTSRYLLFDNNNRLKGWINKTTKEVKPQGFIYTQGSLFEMAFGGIHVISPRLFNLLEDEQWQGKFSIIPFYLSICQEARIQAFSTEGYQWFDIGKPDTLALAEASI